MAIAPLHLHDEGDLPTTDTLLRDLCERQKAVIERLTCLLQECTDSNAKLSGELLEASEARKTALVSLQTNLSVMRATMERAVKQRDVVLRALRALCDHLKNQPVTPLTYFGGEAFKRAYLEAEELLALIDQAAAAAAAKPR